MSKAEKKTDLSFTEQEVNLILMALQELPFKQSAGMLSNVTGQYREKNKSVVKQPSNGKKKK